MSHTLSLVASCTDLFSLCGWKIIPALFGEKLSSSTSNEGITPLLKAISTVSGVILIVTGLAKTMSCSLVTATGIMAPGSSTAPYVSPDSVNSSTVQGHNENYD